MAAVLMVRLYRKDASVGLYPSNDEVNYYRQGTLYEL